MPATVPLLPRMRPSFYDRWTARAAADPRVARRWAWLAPALVTLLAGILRLWNLGHPHALVFDETYYVKDAWAQWVLGYAAKWPDGANAAFVAGETDGFSSQGSFVVHPPLGKFLIGVGMAIFGADSSFGWRITTAVFGTATVLLLYLVAKTLTGSVAFATVASYLMAIDGLAIVLSRIALLDIFLTFFVLLAFWFVLLDRREHVVRLAALVAARSAGGERPAWGPVLWSRPWVMAAGAAAGAATAVKWSGVYVIAGLGIYLVVTDALARRRAGVGFWPTDAALRQGPATFVMFVPIALVVYVASWIGWLATDGGWDRHAADLAPVTGFWSWVPSALQSLWLYHRSIYNFHVELSSAHAYASPAWQWPLLLRPTSMYAETTPYGEGGCSFANGCIENIYSMPNPLIWFASVAAVLYLGYRFVRTRDWRYAVVLTGVAVTYLPWLLYPERTMFQFYTIAMLPFLLLALTFALRDLSGAGRADLYRRLSGQRMVLVFLLVATVLSAFWYPILTGMLVPYDFWRAHNWLPGWV
ncbi:phospholipid carrier-dependent glycosyltransferase [Microbacterium sp. zg.B48]|nr:phospholipid carrier-dependent glycosyltransferase [Microbacterium sp. zg.B48]MCR2762358.1 phospholipid carrier-dependent glycosyltransferase [Microbacterium sp. zg.B48]